MSNYDLDEDFIRHLALPDSFQVFRTERISAEHLEDRDAEAVFEFQNTHYQQHGKIASPQVLGHEFPSLQQSVDAQPVSEATDIVARLRDRWVKNHGRETILNLTREHVDDPAELARVLVTEGRRLSKILVPTGSSYTGDDTERAIGRYHESVVKGRGPSMGFQELDDYFYGQRGLTFMVGAPKSFKSWFTVKAFFENIMAGKRVYLYSLELPAEETDMRLRCLAAKVPYWKYLHHQLDKDDLNAIQEASEILNNWGSYVIEKPGSGQRTVSNLISRARDDGAECVFLDQLQYMENRQRKAVGATNDTKDYFEVINDLRDLSDDGPIWTVHQFNRSVMNSESMPDMQQIKGSSAVEECATVALGLWANKEMRKSNLIQLGTLTARNAGFCTWEAQVYMRTSCGIKLIGKVEE